MFWRERCEEEALKKGVFGVWAGKIHPPPRSRPGSAGRLTEEENLSKLTCSQQLRDEQSREASIFLLPQARGMVQRHAVLCGLSVWGSCISEMFYYLLSASLCGLA